MPHARSPDPRKAGPSPPLRAPTPGEGDWREIARIGAGLVVLVGFGGAESGDDLDWLTGKILDLRLFRGAPEADADPDGAPPGDSGGRGPGEFERSVVDVGGDVLVVSQFTLLAGVRKGRRPDFVAAAPAERALPLYEDLMRRLEARYQRVLRGVFGAEMRVALVNDGPATFVLERG
jgi:D-tyrosyl-tRNA(Tyr) deacylase